MPETNSEPGQLPLQQRAADGNHAGSLEDIPVAQDAAVPQPKPSLTQRMTQARTGAAHTPVISTVRPKPLPRMQMVPQKKKSQSMAMLKIKKTVYGSEKGMDSRQKKMSILVGVLSLLFAGVLVISLGGLGQSKAKAADNEDAQQESTARIQASENLQWQKPQPLPAQLRNPMELQVAQLDQDSNDTTDDLLVVKGIVFSKTKPTAIIDNRIVGEGETLNGVKVVKISKDSVEFEKENKRWSQQVQR